jgi:spermidine synthase
MHRRYLLLAFIFVGVTSVVTQTLFLRELEQVFYGNELCLGVIFAGWLFFTGLGSLIGRKIRKNIFIELQTSLSLILPLEFLLVHSIKTVLDIGPGELISPVPMIILSFTIFAPLSLVLGLLFVQGCQWWAKETKDDMRGVSRVYILDAAGDMIGGFIFAYFLIRFFSLTTLLTMGLLNLAIAAMLSFGLRRNLFRRNLSRRNLRISIAFLTVLCTIGIVCARKIERSVTTHDYTQYQILNHKRSVYGDLVLVRRGSLYSLYENGLLSLTYPLPLEAEKKVHFPMLQVRNPERVLLLGGTVEMVREALKYPVQEVQWVKLDPKTIDVCKPWIDFSILDDPRVSMKWEDGRRFVKTYSGQRFDVVIIDVGEPHTSLLNRFYTLEFFHELQEILNPDGVVALEIASNADYLSRELTEYNGIIYKTLKKVFPNVVLVPGETLRLFGCREASWLSDDPDTLSSRITVPTQYVTEHHLPYEFYRERIDYVRGILDGFTPGILNTDFRPISYYYDIVLKGAYFSHWFRRMFLFFSQVPAWATLLTLTLIFALVGLATRPAVLGIGILGATGIGAQLLLLLCFEVLYGYVYHKIGIITGGFMLGVAIGARWTEKKNSRLSFVIGSMMAYLGILFLVIRWLSHTYVESFQFFFFVMPVLAGMLTGCAWNLANHQLIARGESVKRSSGLLNGMDLFGSCAGSFLISVFFIPIYGINFCFLLLATLNCVALFFLLRAHT